ncbi:hypothetical protein F5888DRAFT_1637991 [Russula emetica]|nr:hypothetical protein F5888DRAFT_1637991 [Russula emetica]
MLARKIMPMPPKRARCCEVRQVWASEELEFGGTKGRGPVVMRETRGVGVWWHESERADGDCAARECKGSMFGQQIPHADVVFLNRHYAQAQSPAYASAHRAFLLVLTRLAPPHALLAAYLWLRGTVLSMINGITFRVVDTQVDQDEHDLVPADDIRSFRGQRVHAARLEAHKPKNCFRRHYVNRWCCGGKLGGERIRGDEEVILFDGKRLCDRD